MESITTALYRSAVPGVTSSATVWVTRYGAWSAEPSTFHGPLPVCAAKTTRLSCPPSTSAESSTVPMAPAAGAFSVRDGRVAGAPSGLPAW